MKALILSGGTGSRMRPLTHTSAKQLLPAGNKPVLFFALESIAAAGLIDVGIVTGETGPQVRQAVGDGSAFGLNVTYIPQDASLGLAHAVATARDWLADDDFVMHLGDIFCAGGIAPFADRFRRAGSAAHVLVARVDDPRSFGVAEVNAGGRLVRLVEKPQSPRSDLAVIGIYFFTPVIHEAIASIRPSARGELEITDALQWLIDARHDLSAQVVTDYWRDVGSVTDMLELNRLVLENLTGKVAGRVDDASEITGDVEIGAGARIENSTIVGPAIIMEGAEISRSYIGPFTSIADGCRIVDSEIEFSILLSRASVDGIRRVRDSFIGRNVTLTGPGGGAGTYQLVLGDDSRMRVVG
jgi:glucose-1-phosphate thymidylyltransferase